MERHHIAAPSPVPLSTWLGNSPEQEQHRFVAVCQTEKPNRALSSGGPLLPSALLNRALPNSPRPGPHLCCAALHVQQLQLGGKEATVGPGELLLMPGVEEGPAVPWGGCV